MAQCFHQILLILSILWLSWLTMMLMHESVGAFHPVGDAQELIAHGVPPWILAAFGVIALVAGFWIWHRASPKLGFGSSPERINPKHAYATAGIAAVVTVLGFAFGNAGA